MGAAGTAGLLPAEAAAAASEGSNGVDRMGMSPDDGVGNGDGVVDITLLIK